MSIDCVDACEAAEDSADCLGLGDVFFEKSTPPWNGRHVDLVIEKTERLALLAQFYAAMLQKRADIEQVEVASRRYDLLELEDEISEEIDIDFEEYAQAAFRSTNRAFALTDPTQFQAEIQDCKNIFKRAAKGVVKCAKAVGHGVKKGAKKTVHYVKEHKKEILIGTGIVAGGVGLYMLFGAAAVAAVAPAAAAGGTSSKQREDEGDSHPHHPDVQPSSGDPNPPSLANALPHFNPVTTNPSSFSPLNQQTADQTPHRKNPVTNIFENLQANRTNPPFDLHYKSHKEAQAPNPALPPQSNVPPYNPITTYPSTFSSLSQTPVVQNPQSTNAVTNLFENLQANRANPQFELHYKNHNETGVPSTAPPPQSSAPIAAPAFQSPITTFMSTLQYGLETMGRGLTKPELEEFQSRLEPLIKSAGEQQNISAAAPPVQTASIVPAPLKSAFTSFWESLIGIPQNIGDHILGVDRSAMISIPQKTSDQILGVDRSAIKPSKSSRYYFTEGTSQDGMCITFINGMNNSFDYATGSGTYLHSLGSGQRIEGIYNHSNGWAADALEIFGLNYSGYSPNTQNLLIQKWTDFHTKNEGNPYAKCLHFCHSQGAIHTRNALMRLPKEIRDRVIVVAIAPAIVIPREICYDSFNYASKKDKVHYGQDLFAHCKASVGAYDEDQHQNLLQTLLQNKEELILLEPHEGAEGWDHDVRSPTYLKKIAEHYADYESQKGEYR